MVILPDGRFPGLSSSGLSISMAPGSSGHGFPMVFPYQNPKKKKKKTPPVFPWFFPWPAIFFDEPHLEAKQGPPQRWAFWPSNRGQICWQVLEKSSRGTSSHMVMAFPFLLLAKAHLLKIKAYNQTHASCRKSPQKAMWATKKKLLRSIILVG